MILNVAFRAKSLPAPVLARVGTLVGVDLHVNLQVVPLSEGLAAAWGRAPERLSAVVHV